VIVYRLPYFITVGDGSVPWCDHSGHRGTGSVLSLGSPVDTVPSGCFLLRVFIPEGLSSYLFYAYSLVEGTSVPLVLKILAHTLGGCSSLSPPSF